jgi:putative oxidoreductase
MVNQGNQSSSQWYDGIVLVRMTLGVLLIFHGWQLFANDDMKGLSDLLFNMSIPFPQAMAYTEKIIELAGGLFLILGLFTRFVAAILFIAFMLITFILREGKIFSVDQHPFLLALFSLAFFFTGAGRISIDHILFINRKEDNKRDPAAVSKKFGRYVSKS